jgi:tetratricopeptide (TPR) repeat protein
MIDKNKSATDMPDLLFRLAELEWDEAKYQYFLKRKEFDKLMIAYDEKTVTKRPEEPKPDYSRAEIHYQKLLSNFSNYRKIDTVLFFLAQSYKLSGNMSKMKQYMSRLVKEYPQSEYFTRANLALAEAFFEKNIMGAAEAYYETVIKDMKSPEYPYALYKLGYTYYNLQKYQQSIDTFRKVIELGLEGKRKIDFQDQAYSALALSYTEVEGGWEKARDYFRSIQAKAGNPELANNQLERMARIFAKQDKIEKMLAVYEYLIGEAPTSAKIPGYADNMIGAYKNQPDLFKTEEQIMRFFKYFEAKTSWGVSNSGDSENQKSARKRANQFREVQLDWLISSFHTKAQTFEKEAKKEKASTYYDKAATYYKLFISTFTESKDLYEKEFFLAEILTYQQQLWDEAIERYTSVLKRDPKGKYSKDSAYKVILCGEEKMAVAKLISEPGHFKDSGKTNTKAQEASVEYTKTQKNDDFKPLPKKELHETEVAFLKACKNYTDFYPEDTEVPSISFRAAELFIRAGHYEEGINRLEVIMTYHSNHKFASFAAATLFDANYRLRRWDQMERWGRYMLKKRNFKVLKKKQLEDIIAISINNYAAELSEKGTKLKDSGKFDAGQKLQDQAVSQMMRFIKEFPKHPKAAIALSNAAFLTERAERTREAVNLYERLIREYKKSPQATEAHFVLGALYESQTKFDKAADYFERMASFPNIDDMSKVKDSLYNAGSIRMALQQYKDAIKIFERYIKKFPNDPATRDLYFNLARAHQKHKDWKAERKIYTRYIKKYAKSNPKSLVDVYLFIAQSHQKENKRSARKLVSKELAQALKAFAKLSDKDKKDKKVAFSAAKARFLEGEYLLQDFLNFKVVPHPQRKLKSSLKKKAELQQLCEKTYFEVLNYKAYLVSAGAFFRIAYMYDTFARTLTNLEPPRVVQENPEFFDTYQMLIEQTVLPLQEKAIESARKALELAHNNRIYNDWSKRSAKLLSQLSPESFPILNDEVVNTEWEVPATFSTQYISEPAGQLGMMIREAQAEEESKETKDDKKKAKKTEESSDSKADDTKKGQSDQAKEQGEGAQSKKENK